jgi:5-methylcytosine-specific restriction endonuclease McrA
MINREQKRKEYMKRYQRDWMRDRRTAWVMENGPCKHCGSWEQLEIDHIIPALKEMNIGSIWSRTKEIRDKELAKCQILCKSCHLKKTLSEREPPTHGTVNMYDDHACRCEDCKEAKRKKGMKRRNPKKYEELYGKL